LRPHVQRQDWHDLRSLEDRAQKVAVLVESVVHSDGEYVDGAVHVNTCENHGSLLRPWLSPHRGVSKDKLTLYLRAFQLRRELYRKPGRDALKHAVRATL